MEEVPDCTVLNIVETVQWVKCGALPEGLIITILANHVTV